jgi:hypothetical protein
MECFNWYDRKWTAWTRRFQPCSHRFHLITCASFSRAHKDSKQKKNRLILDFKMKKQNNVLFSVWIYYHLSLLKCLLVFSMFAGHLARLHHISLTEIREYTLAFTLTCFQLSAWKLYIRYTFLPLLIIWHRSRTAYCPLTVTLQNFK